MSDGNLELEPEPEPEPGPVGHRSSEVQLEVLSRRGRLVEICAGLRDPAFHGSPNPLSREQVALAAFFVEAAYHAGLEQPVPVRGGTVGTHNIHAMERV